MKVVLTAFDEHDVLDLCHAEVLVEVEYEYENNEPVIRSAKTLRVIARKRFREGDSLAAELWALRKIVLDWDVNAKRILENAL